VIGRGTQCEHGVHAGIRQLAATAAANRRGRIAAHIHGIGPVDFGVQR
jgi:hypothetical protein